MPNKAKYRKASAKTSSSTAHGSLPCNPPRTDNYERHLKRFYEPLVLLYTLNDTRAEHTRVAPSHEDISLSPLKDVTRIFLSELAYMCDYDKGGSTVTAIGLQSTPQKYVFWVASNSSPENKILPFLDSLLATLKRIAAATTTFDPQESHRLALQCLGFAAPKIKKYKSLLMAQIKRCLCHLANKEDNSVTDLVNWLRGWGCEQHPIELCRLAYGDRKSDCMRTLQRLSAEPAYKSDRDAIHNAFRLVRHYIGRLGHHFRAADALLSCTLRLPSLLDEFEVRAISTPPRSVLPPVDEMTRLDSIIVRMLPAKSPDLERYQQALTEMDTKHQLSDLFLNNYTNPNLKPRVHAEVQVLEHFHASKLSFAGGDRFIACSKPACFCCLLYFRHHPGNFVEPMSHHKIYLNWRPPDLVDEKDTRSYDERRDVLNAMTPDIRKDALRQIVEKLAPQAWHPDSITGITPSAIYERVQDDLEDDEDATPIPDDLVGVSEPYAENEHLRKNTSSTSSDEDRESVHSTSSSFDRRGRSSFSVHSLLDSIQDGVIEDDSDEEGGILL